MGATSPSPSPAAGQAEGAKPSTGPTAFGINVEDGAPGLDNAPPSSRTAAPSPAAAPSAPAAPGSTSTTGGDPASAAAAVAAPPPAPAAPATSEPFQFAGRTFNSRDAAEQWVRTLDGMGRKHHEMRLTLVERENELARMREENQRLQGSAAPANAQPAAAGEPQQAAGAAVKETAQLFRALAEKHGVEAAVGFLMIEQQKATAQAVAEAVGAAKQELVQALQPLQQRHAQIEKETYADNLLKGVAAIRFGDQPAFPELSDPTKVAEISELMAEMGFEEHHVLTPKGVMAAVGLYRMKHGYTAQQIATSPSPAAPTTAPNPAAQALAAAAAAVAGVSGDAPSRPPQPQSEAELIRKQMLEAPGGQSVNFGVLP